MDDPNIEYIRTAQSEIEYGRMDSGIDLIIRTIDFFIDGERFEELNAVLKEIDTDKFHDQISLSLLTSTLPVKRYLKHRPAFFDKFKKTLQIRGDLVRGDDDGIILKGLE